MSLYLRKTVKKRDISKIDQRIKMTGKIQIKTEMKKNNNQERINKRN